MLSPRFLFFTTVLPPIRFRFPPACLISRSPSLELFLSEKWDTQISRCDDWLSQSKPYFPTTLLPCLQLRSNIMGFCDSVAVIHVSRLHTTSLSRNSEPQFTPPSRKSRGSIDHSPNFEQISSNTLCYRYGTNLLPYTRMSVCVPEIQRCGRSDRRMEKRTQIEIDRGILPRMRINEKDKQKFRGHDSGVNTFNPERT